MNTCLSTFNQSYAFNNYSDKNFTLSCVNYNSFIDLYTRKTGLRLEFFTSNTLWFNSGNKRVLLIDFDQEIL